MHHLSPRPDSGGEYNAGHLVNVHNSFPLMSCRYMGNSKFETMTGQVVHNKRYGEVIPNEFWKYLRINGSEAQWKLKHQQQHLSTY